MAINTNQQGSYQIKKGEMVFWEGHQVHSLNILLQGRINVLISSKGLHRKGEDALAKSYKIFELDKSMFIGVNDILSDGKFSCSCQACEDCAIYVYPHHSLSQTWSLINNQKDYGAFIINSLYTMISNSCTALKKLNELKGKLRMITENLITYFWVLKEFNEFEYTPVQAFFRDGLDTLKMLRDKGVQLLPYFDRQFIETEYSEKSEVEDDCSTSSSMQKIEYYEHLSNLPIDLRKSFFGADMFITSYHCRDEAECYENIISLLKDSFLETENHFKILFSDNSECIYTAYIKAINELAASGKDSSSAIQALEYIVNLIREIITLYKQEYCHKCETDLDYIEHNYQSIKTSLQNGTISQNGSQSVKASSDYSSIPEELKDSAKKILEYSGLPKEQTDSFMMNLLAFRNMKDRLSTDENARNIRNTAASSFFDIYEAVYKRAIENNDNSRLINMFLNYAYMDEKMLTPDQIMTLYRFAGKDSSSGSGSIFTTREWLNKIHGMQRDPSINEFGQDYFDIFRELKKRNQVTEKDKSAYDSNQAGRLSFEIGNMLKTSQKLCHGQISVYFPVLHHEILTRDFENARVTPAKVRESLDKILQVDFSAFYREVHFIDQKKAIEKEIIMKSFEPDIILLPTYGSRAMMWQEISGRNRSTPGRFLLPAFTDEDIDLMILRLIGNFRWELCRTMMGAAWNDVSQPSLTSEYSDYIQFYKKNKDLSDETKDKVKAQTVKFHGKTRDIFTSDYETWINNESKGNVRLNKVARGILYKYCPFCKTVREQLEKQPMYTEMAMQHKNFRSKAARELESRYAKYIKANGSLDPDMEHNLKFFKDM